MKTKPYLKTSISCDVSLRLHEDQVIPTTYMKTSISCDISLQLYEDQAIPTTYMKTSMSCDISLQLYEDQAIPTTFMKTSISCDISLQLYEDQAIPTTYMKTRLNMSPATCNGIFFSVLQDKSKETLELKLHFVTLILDGIRIAYSDHKLIPVKTHVPDLILINCS